MDRILFFDDNHTYVHEQSGLELMPVSTVKKLFSPDFNKYHCSRKAAAKKIFREKKYKELKDAWETGGRHILDPEYITYLERYVPHWETYERVADEIADGWTQLGVDSAAEGDIQHLIEEERSIDEGFSMNYANGLKYPTQPHGKRKDGSNSNIVESLNQLEPGFYPELLIWYMFPEPVFSKTMGKTICGIAGQSDRPFIDPDCCYIDDYKFTIKPLRDFPIEYKNHGAEMHTGPWRDWKSTQVTGYKIQLNLYGWMMEQHGLPPRDLRIQNHGKHIPIRYESKRAGEAVSRVFMEGL